jgi:hypothetical protein
MTRRLANSRMMPSETTSKGIFMRKSILVAVLAAAPLATFANAADDHHATVQPDALKWTAPAAYASGAQFSVIKATLRKKGCTSFV